MRSKLVLLLAFMALAPSAVNALDRAALKPDRLRLEYREPRNPVHTHISKTLREQRVLERLAKFAAPFRLPRDVLMKVEGCDGEVNAFYEDGVIKICYEYIEYIYQNTPKEPVAGGLRPQDAVVGPMVDVVLHELGHAVFDLLEIPLLGREEDAADLFSAYVQLRVGRDEARVLILGIAFLGRKEIEASMAKSLELKEFAKEHGLPAQRYFNVLCLAYGFDRKLFEDAVTRWHLPEERAENCEAEYQTFDHAYRALIQPYVDAKLFKSVQARKWLQFAVQRWPATRAWTFAVPYVSDWDKTDQVPCRLFACVASARGPFSKGVSGRVCRAEISPRRSSRST